MKTEEHIKNEIEAEIKKDEDLGKIYEENKNPIEYWLKQNIKKTHEEAINKFILIPKIKTEREEGEYYFDDFDIDITKFTQKPIDNEILMRSLIDASDEKYIDGGFINFDAANPNKMIVE